MPDRPKSVLDSDWGTGPYGTGPSGGTGGTGGAKANFFAALRANMEKKGWRTITVPGFAWAAVESAHYDIDTIFAAFDADSTDMLEGAHLKLSHWADSQKERLPETRIAVAVFDSTTPDQVEYITRELQKGTRMGVQSMTGVIDLRARRIFEPQEGEGPGNQRIRFPKPVFDQLKAVVEILAAGY